MLDPKLLRQARAAISKTAFSPLTPEAQAAAQQPAPAGPGGMPPMDPAMMGGAPQMDPAMMGGAPPMDPAMMGGAPPMDPAMMGGAPPMDPAMMGGAPPMDPAMMGGAPPAGAQPSITVSADELMALFQQIAAASPQAQAQDEPPGSGRVTNRELMDVLSELSEKVNMLANAIGVQLPATEVGAGAPAGLPSAGPADLAAAAAPKMASRLARRTPLMQAVDMLKRQR